MNYLWENELSELKEGLYYFHVAELKTQLELLKLSSKGFNKQELIERLIHYAVTKKELPPLAIPTVSRSQPKKSYALAPETLMLYGSYKNDLVTRQFFKKLIGDHFHFTAQGIDWLRERWIKGNPPTYAEFAQEWQEEYDRNKQQKRPPKQEWAYIRFVQEYIKHFPEASKKEITDAWEKERQKHVERVRMLFKKI